MPAGFIRLTLNVSNLSSLAEFMQASGIEAVKVIRTIAPTWRSLGTYEAFFYEKDALEIEKWLMDQNCFKLTKEEEVEDIDSEIFSEGS